MFKEKLEKILLRKNFIESGRVKMEIISLIADELLKEKPVLPMTTDYRLGYKTVYWINGYNQALKEIKTKLGIEKGVGVMEKDIVISQDVKITITEKQMAELGVVNIEKHKEVYVLLYKLYCDIWCEACYDMTNEEYRKFALKLLPHIQRLNDILRFKR